MPPTASENCMGGLFSKGILYGVYTALKRNKKSLTE
jgi:hypothetical protein